MEDICLYDFVRDYDRSGVDDQGRDTYKKRSKPLVPNHRLFFPTIEINKARQDVEKASRDEEEYEELGQCVMGAAKSAVVDLQNLQHKPDVKITLEERVAMLNVDQTCIFNQC